MFGLDIVSPITQQDVQANHHTKLTRGIPFICTSLCVVGQMISKTKHSMLRQSVNNVL